MGMGKILVVDDDINICELLRLYIEKDGYEVVIANDGGQAVTKFKTEKPDLLRCHHHENQIGSSPCLCCFGRAEALQGS